MPELSVVLVKKVEAIRPLGVTLSAKRLRANRGERMRLAMTSAVGVELVVSEPVPIDKPLHAQSSRECGTEPSLAPCRIPSGRSISGTRQVALPSLVRSIGS